jgi:hypothetical protein
MSHVADVLMRMAGTWHDHLVHFAPNGAQLDHDPFGGLPGPTPLDNLVYIECDGVHYRQTNVTFRGRPLHVRSFAGDIVDGVLVFHKLGPSAPEHVGVYGGPDCVIYSPRHVDEAWGRYVEPDMIQLFDSDTRRLRTTLLYRHGALARSLSASGVRLSRDGSVRHAWDPRGVDGPVHDLPSVTQVFKRT